MTAVARELRAQVFHVNSRYRGVALQKHLHPVMPFIGRCRNTRLTALQAARGHFDQGQ